MYSIRCSTFSQCSSCRSNVTESYFCNENTRRAAAFNADCSLLMEHLPSTPTLYPLPLLSIHVLPSLHSLTSFPYSQPFSPLPSHSPYDGQVLWRSAIAAPAGPNAFLCNSQPKICKSVNSFSHVHKTPIHSPSWECCNKTFQCLISRCANFHCNGQIF